MNFLEEDLEDILWDNLIGNPSALIDRGLGVGNILKMKRQLRIGNYGVSDIITLSKQELGCGIISIYELKKKKINIDSLLQVVRYYKGIHQWLSKAKKYDPMNITYELIMIGSEVQLDHDWVYLFELFDELDYTVNIIVYTYSYSLEGIMFKQHDLSLYCLTDEGFITNKKDEF